MLEENLIWFTIAAPLFGAACALLAKQWHRRQWVWFLLGFFFTFAAVMAFIFLITWGKKPDTNSSA
jgi:NADH:ubiquinone oxidoreductase subunit 5 (subunit L)/multisubunit Na+/H+ antiporter MnhA subunit